MEESLENQVARLLDQQGVVVLAREVTLAEILLLGSLDEVKSLVAKDWELLVSCLDVDVVVLQRRDRSPDLVRLMEMDRQGAVACQLQVGLVAS